MSNVLSVGKSKLPRTILLVDANPRIRIETATYLRNREYRVVEAMNGNEALRLLRSGRIAHLVLADGDMRSSCDGMEFVRAVEREFPHIKVLLGIAKPWRRPPPFCPLLKRPYNLADTEEAIRAMISELAPHN